MPWVIMVMILYSNKQIDMHTTGEVYATKAVCEVAIKPVLEKARQIAVDPYKPIIKMYLASCMPKQEK